MICSDTAEQRAKALAKLEPMQQSDFEGIYEAMEGLPVTIRFLDPPLHEFVPTDEADIEQLARDMGKTVAEIKAIIAGLHEFNPMMGHRGCRLAVTYPEIAAMQTRAVIKAALNVQAKHPEWTMVPEIMIPLVGEAKELKYVKGVVTETADAIIKEAGSDMKYLVGTMIEIPRAALTADEIAKQADFFSFGTNDLTQMTFGFSRDDAGKFLDAYYDKKIYENDPFAKLDQIGVGRLVGTWPASWAAPSTPTCTWACAASTAATPPAWSSSTGRAWTTCPALPSVCPSPASLPLRPPSRTRSKERLQTSYPKETPPRLCEPGRCFFRSHVCVSERCFSEAGRSASPAVCPRPGRRPHFPVGMKGRRTPATAEMGMVWR